MSDPRIKYFQSDQVQNSKKLDNLSLFTYLLGNPSFSIQFAYSKCITFVKNKIVVIHDFRRKFHRFWQQHIFPFAKLVYIERIKLINLVH